MITPSDFCIYTSEDERKRKPMIDEEVLDEFLTQEGFYCMFENHKQIDISRVRVIDNRITHVSANELYQYLRGVIGKEHKLWLRELKSKWRLLLPQSMSQMVRIQPDMIRDTPVSSYIPFDNGIVMVTANGAELKSYESVLGDKCIMSDTIIHKEIDFSQSEYRKGAWYQFCRNAVGEDGLPYLMRALGYMLHTFKDKSNAKMVVFSDGMDSVSNAAMGGTGKSIISYYSLREIRNVHWEDGKDFNPKGNFKFQGVNLSNDIICLDDMNPQFTPQIIYNKVTGNFSLEEKYRAKKTISYQDSPKIIINTNYKYLMKGDSDKRRSCLIAFTHHYNYNNKPINEFKTPFFDGWIGENAKEYQYFYHFMFDCIRMFLSEGVESYYEEEEPEIAIKLNKISHLIVGESNAMMKSAWGILAETDYQTVQQEMELMGYVVKSVRKRIGGNSNPSTLYYFEK